MKNRQNLSKSVVNPDINFKNFQTRLEYDHELGPSGVNSPASPGESPSVKVKESMDDSKNTRALRKGLINMEELGLRYSLNQKGKRRESMLEFDGIIDRENLQIVNTLLNLNGGCGEEQVKKLKFELLG